MLIEYELQGTKEFHKGIFDTTGFWVRCGEEKDDVTGEVTSAKIWSHFSFTFESESISYAQAVYKGLLHVLAEAGDFEHPCGFIRQVR